MGWRVPPNKGVIEFPAILHIRVTQAMHAEVTARGGARWLRPIIEANTRPPPATSPAATDGDYGGKIPAGTVIAKRSRRVTRRQEPKKSSKRVTLDNKNRRRV